MVADWSEGTRPFDRSGSGSGSGERRGRRRVVAVLALLVVTIGAMALAGLLPAGAPEVAADTVSCTRQTGVTDTIKQYVGANNGSFDTATNWSPSGVPTATSIVCIPSNRTVVMGNNRTVGGVNVQGGLSVPSGITLTVNSNSSSLPSTTGQSGTINNLSLAGTLAGTMALDLPGASTLTGAITGTGAKIVPSGATAALNGALRIGSATTVGTVRIAGTATWTLTTDLSLGAGALIDVVSGGVLRANADDGSAIRDIHTSGTSPRVLVESGGLLEAATNGTVYAGTSLDNNGKVLATTGTLYVNAQSTGQSDTGEWSGTTGSIILSQSRLFGVGASVTGANGITVVSSLTTPTSLPTPISTIHLSGTLSGSQVISGSFDWTGTGTVLSGAGTTLVDSAATGVIPAYASVGGAHILWNKGSLRWDPSAYWYGWLTFYDTSQFQNSGLFTIVHTPDLVNGSGGIAGSGTTSRFINRSGGRIVQVAGNDTTPFSNIAFDDQGTVQVDTGTLQFGAAPAGVKDTGSWTVASGATIEFIGDRTEDAATFSGAGTFALRSGTLDFGTTPITVPGLRQDGGNVSGNLTINSGYAWIGGTHTGAGTTTIPAGVTLAVPQQAIVDGGHVLSNFGTLTLGTGMALDLNGGRLVNSGRFRCIDLGGTVRSYSDSSVFTNASGGSVSVETTAGCSLGSFENLGTVSVAAGQLEVWGSPAGSTGDSGTWTSAVGARIMFEGDRVFNGGTIGGGGTNITSGTVAFSGDLTVGNLLWGSNTNFRSPGTMTVTGTLTLDSTLLADHWYFGGKVLNQGTVLAPIDGELGLLDGALFENASGGTFRVTKPVGRDGSFTMVSLAENGRDIGTGRFQNDAGGVLVSTTAQLRSNGVFDNDGTVRVDAGDFMLLGSSSVGHADAGAYQVAGGASLTFNTQPGEARRLASGATVTGPGTVIWGNDPTGGTYINTTITWDSSSTTSPPVSRTTTIGSGAVLLWGRGILYGGTILNQGTIRLNTTNSGSSMANGARLLNAGLVELASDSGYLVDANPGGAVSMFTNQSTGTVRMNRTGTLNIGVPFHNDGTVEVASGVLTLTGGFDNFAGTTLTGGNYVLSGILRFTGAQLVTNRATIVLNLRGAIQNENQVNALTSFLANDTSGSLTLNTGFSVVGTFANAGSILVGTGMFSTTAFTQSAGTTTVAAFATLKATGSTIAIDGGALTGAGNITGKISGNGRVAPGMTAGSAAKIAGTSTYAPGASGTLDIDLRGATTAGTDYDQLAVAGAATLGGTLNISTSFTPTRGQTFTVLTFASRTGTFANITGWQLPGGLALQVGYNATSVVLTVVSVPGAPTAVSGVRGDGRVVLSWTAPVDDGGSPVTGYEVTPFIGGVAQPVRSFGTTATTQVIDGLTNRTAYTFTVAAKNMAGTGAASVASAAVIPATVPGAPTAVSGVRGDGQVVLSWTAPVDDGGDAITGYDVTPYVGGSAQPTQTFTASATTRTITGLSNGTAYTFTVAAKNTVGRGAQSIASSAVTPATVPGAPTGVSGVRGAGQVTLSWTAPVSNGGSPITLYKVVAHSQVGSTVFVFCSPATTNCVIERLINGVAYTFTVKAMNEVGDSADSVASAAVTPATVPGAPTAVSGVRGDGLVMLSWVVPDSGGDPITGHDITAYIDGVAQRVVFAPELASQPVSGGIEFRTISGLSNGTAYTFTVAARNTVGTGSASVASAPVTPATVPTAPTIVSAVPGEQSVTLSWTAPLSNGGDPIIGYQVTFQKGTGLQPGPVSLPRLFQSTATSQTLGGLTPGEFYRFSVAAVNSVGTGVLSSEASAVPLAPTSVPGAPTGVSAAGGNRSVTLTWTDPVNTGGLVISGYAVTPSIAGVAQPVILLPAALSTTSPTRTATVTGLTNGVAYTFTVAARNPNGTGAASVASAPVTPAITAPAAPFALVAVRGNGVVTLSWSAPADNGGSPVTGYEVTPYIGGVAQTVRTFATTATAQVITGLTNGTGYTFTVAARNAVGTGIASGASPSATPATVPGAPTIGLAPVIGNTQITLSWVAPVGDGGAPITGYVVTPYISGVAQPVRTFTTSATTQIITGLTNGTSYTFKVAAVNSVGAGALSAAAKVSPGTVPAAPTIGTAVRGNAQVTLSWTAPTDTGGRPITGYVVTPYIGGVAQPVRTFTTSATTQVITGLTNGTSYTFKVAAVNLLGTGSQSAASASATPATVPGAPTILTAVAGSRSVTLSWSVPTVDGGAPITGYVVTPYLNGVAQPARTFTTTATSQLITGLQPSTSYTFKVSAVNAVGTGALSSASGSVKTLS